MVLQWYIFDMIHINDTYDKITRNVSTQALTYITFFLIALSQHHILIISPFLSRLKSDEH